MHDDSTRFGGSLPLCSPPLPLHLQAAYLGIFVWASRDEDGYLKHRHRYIRGERCRLLLDSIALPYTLASPVLSLPAGLRLLMVLTPKLTDTAFEHLDVSEYNQSMVVMTIFASSIYIFWVESLAFHLPLWEHAAAVILLLSHSISRNATLCSSGIAAKPLQCSFLPQLCLDVRIMMACLFLLAAPVLHSKSEWWLSMGQWAQQIGLLLSPSDAVLHVSVSIKMYSVTV